MLGASVAEFDFGSHGGQQVALSNDVANLGNVFEDHRFVGEKGRGHRGQRGVLGAADANRANKRVAATDDEFVHGWESYTAGADRNSGRA